MNTQFDATDAPLVRLAHIPRDGTWEILHDDDVDGVPTRRWIGFRSGHHLFPGSEHSAVVVVARPRSESTARNST